jgi:hypothetical protein
MLATPAEIFLQGKHVKRVCLNQPRCSVLWNIKPLCISSSKVDESFLLFGAGLQDDLGSIGPRGRWFVRQREQKGFD